MDKQQPQDSTATGQPQPTLRERVELVHRLRQAHAAARDELNQRRQQWEEANADWFEQLRLCEQDVDDAESELRKAALAEYHVSGNKRPGPGVEVDARRYAARVLLAAYLGKALAAEGES